MTFFYSTTQRDVTLPYSLFSGRRVLDRGEISSRLLSGSIRPRTAVREFGSRVRAVERGFVIPAGTPWDRIGSIRDAFGVPVTELISLEGVLELLSAFADPRVTFRVDENSSYGYILAETPSHLVNRVLETEGLMRTLRRYENPDQYYGNDLANLVHRLELAEATRVEIIRRLRWSGNLVGFQTEPRTDVRSQKVGRSGGGDFAAMFLQFRSQLESSRDDALSLLTPPERGTRSSLRWGIEIEAVDIEGIRTPQGWDLRGDGSLRGEYRSGEDHERYHDEDCGAYDSEDDGDCDDYDGCGGGEYTQTGEWNSPILRSVHSRGLQHLTSALEGRLSNSTPGIHVHVEASHLTATQAARVALIYSLWEPLFSFEYEREERSYCQSLSARNVQDLLQRGRQYTRAGTPVREFGLGNRYSTVNMQALPSHGTIEFRAMGPRYDYEVLIRWAMFCRELVNLAASSLTQREILSVRSMSDVVVLMERYGKETASSDLPREAAHLGPNSVRQADNLIDQFDDYSRQLAYA